MKTMKALKPHRYKGKMRNVGDEYPVARADIRTLEALGRGVQVFPEQKAPELPSRFYNYSAMTAEPATAEETAPKKKRAYKRRDLTAE